MGYVESSLMPNERILFRAHVHPIVFLPPALSILIGILLALPGLGSSQQVQPQTQPDSAVSLLLLTACCASAFFVANGVWTGIQALVLILTTEFAVTNRRIIAKRGFIRRHTLEMLLGKVESISVHQNILGRLLNFGTVTVIGTGGTRESFRAIANPMRVRRNIHQIIERHTAPTSPPGRASL